MRVLIHITNATQSQLLSSTFILWLLALKLDVIIHDTGLFSNRKVYNTTKCPDLFMFKSFLINNDFSSLRNLRDALNITKLEKINFVS